jgi:TM2 domain-containing membrane protein YozV
MAFGLFPELRLAQLITANRKNSLHWLSLIFPGYGQLLNGQPKKGVLFSSLFVLGIFSAISLFFTYSINWYEYVEELGINQVETAMIGMALAVMIGAASWVLAIFDTFIVRKYPHLKRPVSSRIKRFLGIGMSRYDKAPLRRTSLKFVAVSLILLGVAAFQLSRDPARSFYATRLKEVQGTFKQKGMIILPGLIDRIEISDNLEIKVDKLIRHALAEVSKYKKDLSL